VLDASQLASGRIQLLAKLLDDDHVVRITGLEALDGLHQPLLGLRELRCDPNQVTLEVLAQPAKVFNLLVEAALKGLHFGVHLLATPVGNAAGEGQAGEEEEP